jgi:hypothetical protein
MSENSMPVQVRRSAWLAVGMMAAAIVSLTNPMLFESSRIVWPLSGLTGAALGAAAVGRASRIGKFAFAGGGCAGLIVAYFSGIGWPFIQASDLGAVVGALAAGLAMLTLGAFALVATLAPHWP